MGLIVEVHLSHENILTTNISQITVILLHTLACVEMQAFCYIPLHRSAWSLYVHTIDYYHTYVHPIALKWCTNSAQSLKYTYY